MSEKVRVRITATQRVSYSQTVTMTRDEYDKLQKRLDDDQTFGKQSTDEDLGGWLDLRDSDSDGDVEDIEIYMCDENGDEYGRA